MHFGPFGSWGIALLGAKLGMLNGLASGASLAAVLTMVALSILAFMNSVSLNNAENIKRQAEEELRKMVQELDAGNRALQIEIEARKRMEERAHHLATHDDLTGLPNRLLFLDRFQQVISNVMRSSSGCALLFIDVDGFKAINDQYGHQAGDELLKSLAARLRTVMRPGDTVARLGGDEFAVIVVPPTDKEGAIVSAKRLIEVASVPFRINFPGSSQSIEVTIGLSIGVALLPIHARDLDGLIRIADGAMYQAKATGKNRYSVAR